MLISNPNGDVESAVNYMILEFEAEVQARDQFKVDSVQMVFKGIRSDE